ncbi:DUF5324 family protein [Streptomyces sp. MUM 178J]|uniref:DUF5324 family protein n=1 Tax=Streptomyces sp. MUM 178J TaxID=2791991 RepID=UPI001F047B05|nr:DUF5324 family protein [Streptomyces sp. MUM 178J]WRQ82468.1 DUF5324 family protein [Streptomyces sp. MUM 178J]
MTRKDSVRTATTAAKDSVRHAAEAVAPYAGTAKDQAAHYAQLYAHEARARYGPKLALAAHEAACQARIQYGARVAPHVPPRMDEAAHRAAAQARKAARQAADYTVPRIEHARAVAQPVRQEAAARSAAALAALRSPVTAQEIHKLARKHERRSRAGRLAKGFAVFGVLFGGAVAVWKWWDKQANPDWLVEPPMATEVDERGRVTSVDGSERGADAEPESPDEERG